MCGYNDELKIVHEFLKKQYSKEFKSNKIKTEDERLRWGHAVQVIGLIAYNYTILPKMKTEPNRNINLNNLSNKTTANNNPQNNME